MFLLSVYTSKKFKLLTRICIYMCVCVCVCVCVCIYSTGREIVPNRGANATKFFTLATKS